MATASKLTIVGGANSAGKSTFARVFLRDNSEFVFLNAGEIAKEMQPDDLYAARFDAGRESLRRLDKLRDARTDLLLESTLSGLTLARQLRTFADAGYAIRVVYVFLDNAVASVNRVAGRMLPDGHYVPTADIVRRYDRSRQNFWFTYRQLANEWNLISNSGNDFLEVAAFEEQQVELFDNESFWQFVLPLDPNFSPL